MTKKKNRITKLVHLQGIRSMVVVLISIVEAKKSALKKWFLRKLFLRRKVAEKSVVSEWKKHMTKFTFASSQLSFLALHLICLLSHSESQALATLSKYLR